jgi:hypothetical protein
MEYLQTGAMRTTEEILAAFAECRRQRGSEADLDQPVLEGAAR